MGEIDEPRRVEVVPITKPVKQPMPEPARPAPVKPREPEKVPV